MARLFYVFYGYPTTTYFLSFMTVYVTSGVCAGFMWRFVYMCVCVCLYPYNLTGRAGMQQTCGRFTNMISECWIKCGNQCGIWWCLSTTILLCIFTFVLDPFRNSVTISSTNINCILWHFLEGKLQECSCILTMHGKLFSLPYNTVLCKQPEKDRHTLAPLPLIETVW